MGFNEAAMLQQMKKGQGETNERLDRLVAAAEETNRLLTEIAALLARSS